MVCLALAGENVRGQQAPVTLQVGVVRHNPGKHTSATQDQSNVALWLTPIDESGAAILVPASASSERRSPQLVQQNKAFEPHVLVVQAGSVVEFPNKDPFFHNVFSLFNGKRFDLGLYEGGSSNAARFEKPGVSFLFCNIHPEMSAVIIAVDTPYYALSDRAGRITIPGVPEGRYRLRVWYERSSSEDLKALERIVTVIGSARTLETLQVVDNGDFKLSHKNKYGQDYTPPPTPTYQRP
jgi:plastocyanin